MKHKGHNMVACFIVLSVLFISCMKDKGNYTYKQVTDIVVVKGVDSLYNVDVLNDSLEIDPVITTLAGQPADTSSYTYSWQLNQEIGSQDYPNLIPLSTSSILHIAKDKMKSTVTSASVRGNLFGAWSAFFRITDKKTGLFKDTYFNIIFSSLSYKGWLLLCDPEDGTSRLSMVSSLSGDSLVADILGSVGSKFPTDGTPSFIADDYSYSFVRTSTPQPFIGTSKHFAILGPDTLEYIPPRYDFKNYITGDQPTDFSTAKFYTNGYLHYLYNDGNIYGVYEYYANRFAQCNFLNNIKFRASKFVCPFLSYDAGAIVFNEDTKTFLRNTTDAFCLELPVGTLFDFSTKQNLRYMEYTPTFNGGEVFAILDSTSKINLARFSETGIQSYYKEITAPDIQKADLFAVDDNFGYIFYSVGGKLYQYNMTEGSTNLIHDYGNNKITVLKSYTDNRDIFGVVFGNVVVATYDEANKSSGTFDLYSNPGLDGSMSLLKTIKNTGKIVDVAYK